MSKHGITYHTDTLDVEVRLNGRKVGHIVSATGGYRYRAIGSHGNHYGEIYPTVAEVMRTLEEE